MIDPEQLRQFIAVAEHLSFTHASEELHISHSTLSRNVSRLESQFGTPLFTRSTRSVSLTPAGELLLRRGRVLLEDAETLERDVRARAPADKPHLYLITFNFFDHRIFGIWEQFHMENPGVDMSIHYGSPEMVKAAVRDGDADIGLTFDFALEADSRYEVLPLLNGEFVVVTSSSHPLAGRDSIDINDPMLEHPLILNALNYKFVSKIGSYATFRQQHADARPLPMDSLILQIKANLGIGLLPEHTALQIGAGCSILSLDGVNTDYRVVMFWRKDGVNAVLRNLIDRFRSLV